MTTRCLERNSATGRDGLSTRKDMRSSIPAAQLASSIVPFADSLKAVACPIWIGKESKLLPERSRTAVPTQPNPGQPCGCTQFPIHRELTCQLLVEADLRGNLAFEPVLCDVDALWCTHQLVSIPLIWASRICSTLPKSVNFPVSVGKVPSNSHRVMSRLAVPGVSQRKATSAQSAPGTLTQFP